MFETIIRNPDFIAVKSSDREFRGHGFLEEDDVLVKTKVNQNDSEIYVTAERTELEQVRLR